MSRSRHTDPKFIIAARNAQRDEQGRVLLPRIVERPPLVGDIHPVPRRKLALLISRLPAELYHGLSLIELSPRNGDIGQPYGEYFEGSKVIRLYSLPPVLHFDFIASKDRPFFEISGARISANERGYTVEWDDPYSMGFWFYYRTVLHELGHHHRFQYRSKRGRPGRRLDEEIMADKYCYWAGIGRLSPKKYARSELGMLRSLVCANGAEVNQPRASKAPPWVRRTRKYPAP